MSLSISLDDIEASKRRKLHLIRSKIWDALTEPPDFVCASMKLGATSLRQLFSFALEAFLYWIIMEIGSIPRSTILQCLLLTQKRPQKSCCNALIYGSCLHIKPMGRRAMRIFRSAPGDRQRVVGASPTR